MKFLIITLGVLFGLNSWADKTAEPDPFYFVVEGKVQKFDEHFVFLKQKDGKTMWVPRDTVIGKIHAGAAVRSVLSPAVIAKNHEALQKLNGKSR